MAFLIPITVIIGFWVFLITGAMAKARLRELQVRERIAMIEKGMVPSPVADPKGFDRAVRRYDRRSGRNPSRHRSAGITLVGAGLGLMLMIGFAAEEPQKAVGIGGFVVMLGLAFIINGTFNQRQIEFDETAGPESPLEASSTPAKLE